MASLKMCVWGAVFPVLAGGLWCEATTLTTLRRRVMHTRRRMHDLPIGIHRVDADRREAADVAGLHTDGVRRGSEALGVAQDRVAHERLAVGLTVDRDLHVTRVREGPV